MRVSNSLAGPGLALLSSGMWGSADFFGGLVSKRLPAMAVVGWSQAVALLVGAVAAVVTTAYTAPTGWWPWALLAGVSGSVGLVAFYAALANGTMGVVSPIAGLGAVVPVAAGMLAGERPSGLQVTGILLALAGTALASGPEVIGRGSRAGLRPVLLALVAAIAFGFALLAIGRGSEFSALMTLVGVRATSVTGFLLVAVSLRTLGGVVTRDVPALAGIGLADMAANLCFGVATTMGLLSVTAVLGSLYPVATVLLARLVLKERLLRVQWVGIAVALAGVGLIAA